MLRKRWMKHGDDPYVMKQSKHDPYRPQIPADCGLLATPMGMTTVRPGDWIVIDENGKRSIETDPSILNDLDSVSRPNEGSR